MGRRYELDLREVLGEMPANLALPAGMQVEVDFVDDHDRRFMEGVRTTRIALQQPPRDVHRPGEYRAIAKTQLAEGHSSVGGLHMNAGFIERNPGHTRRTEDFDVLRILNVRQYRR